MSEKPTYNVKLTLLSTFSGFFYNAVEEIVSDFARLSTALRQSVVSGMLVVSCRVLLRKEMLESKPPDKGVVQRRDVKHT